MCEIDWNLLFKYLSLFAVLISVVYGFVQFSKNIRSNQKLNRIKDLREIISEYYTALDQYSTMHSNFSEMLRLISSNIGYGELGISKEEIEKRNKKWDNLMLNNPNFMNHAYFPYLKASGEYNRSYTKLFLYLDSNEKTHKKFIEILTDLKKQFDKAEKRINQLESFKFKKFANKNRDEFIVEASILLKNEELEVKKILSWNPLK